jgi:hypothetical protein
MPGQFTVQLFDILVYLIPGLAFLMGIDRMNRGQLSAALVRDHAQFSVVYILLIAFLGGVIVHILSGIAYGLYRRLIDDAFCAHTFRETKGYERVRSVLLEKHGEAIQDDEDLYLVAEVFVSERASQGGARVSRLMALSILCRNAIIPLALLGTATAFHAYGARSVQFWLGLPVGVLIGSALLLRGMFAYWTAAIHAVVRICLVLSGTAAVGLSVTAAAAGPSTEASAEGTLTARCR